MRQPQHRRQPRPVSNSVSHTRGARQTCEALALSALIGVHPRQKKPFFLISEPAALIKL
jgi:hypothetical protein